VDAQDSGGLRGDGDRDIAKAIGMACAVALFRGTGE
jgi:hypothetical protein